MKHHLFFGMLAMVLLLTNCGAANEPGKAGGSNLYQLTKDDYVCHTWNDKRIKQVMGLMPQDMLKNWDGDLKKRAEQAFGGIPNKYVSWMAKVHEINGFSISAEDPGFTGGLVVGNEKYPEQMYIYPTTEIVDLVLQHEIGHVTMYEIKAESIDQHVDFMGELAPIADTEHENPNLNDYPALYDVGTESYHKEFWAEAFNSFYCSAFTNDLVKKQFPKTYPLLVKYLLPPLWKNGFKQAKDN